MIFVSEKIDLITFEHNYRNNYKVVGWKDFKLTLTFEHNFSELNFSRLILDGALQKSDENNNILTAPFSYEEIREAVWSYEGNKSFGSNGFNFIKSVGIC